MKTIRQFLFFIVLPVAMLISCAVVKRNYHDTCLHYNKYFLANEKMKEIELELWKSHKDDYNAILKVYPDCDTNMSKTIKPQTEFCMKKASIGIDWHGGTYWAKESWNGESRWADNAFILIGKSRIYLNDFKNANETFKYVNTKTKNEHDRAEALIWLANAYTRKGDYFAAAEVFNKMDVEKLNAKNKREYYLAKTYFHGQVGEFAHVNKYVQKAIPLTSRWVYKREKKARLHFIAAQTYQMYGKDSSAYINYQKAVKNNPPYELGFYARLFAAEVASVNSNKQTKKINRHFKKMLKDPKNKEYNDKIYYEMANFELKHKNTNKAVVYLKKSLKTEIQNPVQKGYTYLKLGELNYEVFKNYNKAKLYYDSALITLPKTHKDFARISKRKNILDEFAKHYNTIVTEDSVQKLAKLSPEALTAKLEKIINDDYLRQKEEFMAEKRAAKAKAAQEALAKEQNGTDFLSMDPNAKWYFYSMTSITEGKAKFTKIWGERVLEDNWRRSIKEKVDTPVEIEDVDTTQKVSSKVTIDDNKPKPDKDGFIGQKLVKENLLANIPFDDAKLEASNAKIQESMFTLGKIYHFKLEELDNAAQQYETLLKRYPEGMFNGNTLYLLYLIYKDSDPKKAEHYKNLLIGQYPNNEYAKSFIDPDWRIKENKEYAMYEAQYKVIFNLYESKNFKQADTLAATTLIESPKTPFKSKIELIRVLITARTKNIYAYRDSLRHYMETNTDEVTNSYAKNLYNQCDERIKLKEEIEKKWKHRLDSVAKEEALEKAKADSIALSKTMKFKKTKEKTKDTTALNTNSEYLKSKYDAINKNEQQVVNENQQVPQGLNKPNENVPNTEQILNSQAPEVPISNMEAEKIGLPTEQQEPKNTASPK